MVIWKPPWSPVFLFEHILSRYLCYSSIYFHFKLFIKVWDCWKLHNQLTSPAGGLNAMYMFLLVIFGLMLLELRTYMIDKILKWSLASNNYNHRSWIIWASNVSIAISSTSNICEAQASIFFQWVVVINNLLI